MLSTLLRRGVRGSCRQRLFCTGQKTLLQDITTIAKSHKDALQMVGGLMSITILGAFFVGDHVRLRSDFEKLEQSVSKLEERMSRDMSKLEERMSRDMGRIDNTMQEIRSYIFATRSATPGHSADDVSAKK